jgi:hypothetical protein
MVAEPRIADRCLSDLTVTFASVVPTIVQAQVHLTHVRRANLADEIAREISLLTISLYGVARQERLTSTGPELRRRE